jgi:hypothetical protein
LVLLLELETGEQWDALLGLEWEPTMGSRWGKKLGLEKVEKRERGLVEGLAAQMAVVLEDELGCHLG